MFPQMLWKRTLRDSLNLEPEIVSLSNLETNSIRNGPGSKVIEVPFNHVLFVTQAHFCITGNPGILWDYARLTFCLYGDYPASLSGINLCFSNTSFSTGGLNSIYASFSGQLILPSRSQVFFDWQQNGTNLQRINWHLQGFYLPRLNIVQPT
jgi:hypothetical protein